MLTPREAVANRNGAELLGRDRIRAANEVGNELAARGIDLPGMAEGEDDVFERVAGGGGVEGLMPAMWQRQYGMPGGLLKVAGGTENVTPGSIGWVDPKAVDPVWQEIQLTAPHLDLEALKKSAEKKGISAETIKGLLGAGKDLGLFGGGGGSYAGAVDNTGSYYGLSSYGTTGYGKGEEDIMKKYQRGTTNVPVVQGGPDRRIEPRGAPPSLVRPGMGTEPGGDPRLAPHDFTLPTGRAPTPSAGSQPPGYGGGAPVGGGTGTPWGVAGQSYGPGITAMMQGLSGGGSQRGGSPYGQALGAGGTPIGGGGSPLGVGGYGGGSPYGAGVASMLQGFGGTPYGGGTPIGGGTPYGGGPVAPEAPMLRGQPQEDPFRGWGHLRRTLYGRGGAGRDRGMFGFAGGTESVGSYAGYPQPDSPGVAADGLEYHGDAGGWYGPTNETEDDYTQFNTPLNYNRGSPYEGVNFLRLARGITSVPGWF